MQNGTMNVDRGKWVVPAAVGELDVGLVEIDDDSGDHGTEIQSHVVVVEIPELDVHERVELDCGGVGGCGDVDVQPGVAKGGLVGGSDEAEATIDVGGVESGDGESELCGEAIAKRNGGGVERPAGARGQDGEVAETGRGG